MLESGRSDVDFVRCYSGFDKRMSRVKGDLGVKSTDQSLSSLSICLVLYITYTVSSWFFRLLNFRRYAYACMRVKKEDSVMECIG